MRPGLLYLARSMIDQLSILGIRSFDNIKPEVIKFRGPLSLIVGCNGSGKTTIIECLKYATTGQQPPNSVGGAFIHDPNLCGEKEVMAQVKLGFKTATGATFVVSRSMQLTVNKTSRKFKSLDSSLLMLKDGERTSMTTRVGELDRIIPQYLGVSEAVLDSVIFCHQDDSLWPMSQPLILKKKFDEIFEASKWTKAVDNLKLLKKDHKALLKEQKIWEINLKVNKDKGERVKSKAYALQAEVADLNAQLVTIDKKVKIAIENKVAKKAEAEQAAGIVSKLNSHRNQADFFRDQIEHLKKTLVELKEPDDWLRTTLSQYEERMAQYQSEVDGYNRQYGELEHELAATRRELSEKHKEQGQYQAHKESYEAKIVDRAQLVKEQARRLGIRGYNGDIDENQVLEFTSRVRKLSEEKDRELERIKKETDDELRQMSAALKDLDNLRTTATTQRLNAKQTLVNNDKKLESLQRDVDAIVMDEGGKAAIVASLKAIQDRLRAAENGFVEMAYDQSLRSQKQELGVLREEEEKLYLEQQQCNKLANERAELGISRDLLAKAKTTLDALTVSHEKRLSSLLGSDLRVDTVEHEFQAVLDKRVLVLADAKKEQTDTTNDLSNIEYTIKDIRENLEKKKERQNNHRETVLNSITTVEGNPLSSIDQYEGELESMETDRDDIRKDIDGYTYVNDFYAKCLDTVNSHNKCKLCERPFADKRERSSALEKINKKLAVDARKTLQAELDTLEVDLQKAMAVRPQYDSLKVLSQEIEVLENKLATKNKEKDTTLQKLNRDDDVVNRQQSSLKEAESLKSIVSSISRAVVSIAEMESDVSRITSQQSLSSSSLSLDDLNEKSDVCKQAIRSLTQKFEKTQADKDTARNKIISLESEASSQSNRLSNAQHALDNKNAKLSQIGDYGHDNDQQRDTIVRIDSELQSLEPKFKVANAKNDEVKQRGRGREKELQVERNKLNDTVNQFKVVESDINKYIDGGGPQRLIASQRAIKGLDQKVQSMGEEITSIARKGNEIKGLLDDSERTKRNIEDNIHYRDMLRKQEELHVMITELEGINIGADYARLAREADNADKHHESLAAQRGKLFGQASSKDEELLGVVQEYDNEYKDAKEKYREAHIKVETTTAAIEDLGKYEHALDNAIMKYHSLKMDQINRIAGELWQNTYQGTDVDTIMIKSDNEGASASATRRNYNYRVVMVKQDTEMDMRGRCSAGQKVLASIIIRLALAECFGANCGIIALDEPTTNLDRDTIKSLAESLHMIIKQRKGQSNFQLIVITHDEEFLKEMKCQDFADNYYRIRRNEKQNSVIETQSIAGLVQG